MSDDDSVQGGLEVVSLAEARKQKRQKTSGHASTLNPRAPYANASAFLTLNYMRNGRRTLHRHRGTFYAWDGTHYQTIDEADLRAALYGFLKDAGVEPNRAIVSDTLDSLRAHAHLEGKVSTPAWLGPTVSDLPASEIIACANGLLHLPTLELLPHTPDFFTPNALPYDFDLEAAQPEAFLRFLSALWPDDPEAIATLQEIFGYALVGDTTQQKIFLIVGPKRSGKGTIARVLTAMLGSDNVTAPTLSGMATNFGLAAHRQDARHHQRRAPQRKSRSSGDCRAAPVHQRRRRTHHRP